MNRGIGEYEIGRVIGRGKFGTVYLAHNRVTGDPKAIKIINKETLLNPKMIRKEISTMKLIKHPYVVQLLEVLATKSKVYIVLEYAGGGELCDRIINVGKLSEDEARKYFQQLILAVDYCHSRGVYHRDLKLENLLLDTKGNLKVSDFGLSALSQQCREDGLLHTTCGTPNYVAPEVIHGKGYNGALADLWSCGIILYVMLVGCLPFDEPNTIALHRKACQANFTIPSWLSNGSKNLIKRILDPNPKTRIGVPEILSNEWFKTGYTPVGGFEMDMEIDDIDPLFDQGKDMEKRRPPLVNAFDIISMSPGLNLSGLFKGRKDLTKKETQFTTKEPAEAIISKIEGLAKSLGFSVKEKNYQVRLQSTYPGRKGHLSISSKVFEVSPSLFMVNMRKTSGDTLEYHEFHKKLAITLEDIIWNNEDDTA